MVSKQMRSRAARAPLAIVGEIRHPCFAEGKSRRRPRVARPAPKQKQRNGHSYKRSVLEKRANSKTQVADIVHDGKPDPADFVVKECSRGVLSTLAPVCDAACSGIGRSDKRDGEENRREEKNHPRTFSGSHFSFHLSFKTQSFLFGKFGKPSADLEREGHPSKMAQSMAMRPARTQILLLLIYSREP